MGLENHVGPNSEVAGPQRPYYVAGWADNRDSKRKKKSGAIAATGARSARKYSSQAAGIIYWSLPRQP